MARFVRPPTIRPTRQPKFEWRACEARCFAGFMLPKSQRQGIQREGGGRSTRQMSPSELSTAVRIASQGPRKQDMRLWREYAEAALFHAGAMQPKQMAFIANGFARAEVPDREVFDRMSDQAIHCVDEFDPRDVALFLNAFAKLQFRDLALFKVFSKSIRRSAPTGFGEQQLALISNAYARLEIADGPLFQKLSSWTVEKVVELTPQGTAAVANAWAKVTFRDENLFAALESAIGRNLSSFKAQHVANLLNAYAKLQLKDAEVLGQLALQIPSRARDLVPMELSQSLHALVKLGIASENRKALFCLAEAVEERASEFHSRQLAVSMHAFSMLSTNHGKMFQSLAPQVLATLGMADDQSVAMLFCAYARSGQVHEQVIRGLMDKLSDAIPNSEQQTQVQLFYACGRLALHKEPLTRVLAGSLRGKVPSLSSQHVANCLLTISRLSLASEEFAALLAALQARLLRKDVNFEVQQLANSFHAIAGIHGDGAPVQLHPTPLPAPVLQILIDQVEKSGPSWAEHPQLMASVAVSCARLQHSSAALFSLVSKTVRSGARANLSNRNLSDLLCAYAALGYFDIDLFSWVLGQLDANGRLASIPMDSLVNVLSALDYANSAAPAAGISSWEEPRTLHLATEAEGHRRGDGPMSLLFLQCPESFQLQATAFYEQVGLALLTLSRSLPALQLQDLALPFARAGLLDNAVPFDLVTEETRHFFKTAALAAPPPPSLLKVQGNPCIQELVDDGGPAAPGVDDPPAAGTQCLLDLLLEELQSGAASEDGAGRHDGARLARLLARYAGLLPPGNAEGSSARSAPPAVLDPILRCLGVVLKDSARSLTFNDLAAALETLADAGIRPRSVLEALMSAAEAFQFPALQDDAATSVAALLHGWRASGRQLSPALRRRLKDFLSQFEAAGSSFSMLGDRPFRVAARILAATDSGLIHEEGRSLQKFLHTLLAEAVDSHGHHHPDLFELLLALQQVESDASLVELLNDTKVVLQVLLCQKAPIGVQPARLVELLEMLARSGEWGSELLSAIAEEALSQSQVLGPAGIASALQALSRLGALAEPRCHLSQSWASLLKKDIGQKLQVSFRQESSQLARLAADLMRSLLVLERRLSVAEAAKGAHFCTLAFDSSVLTESERAEAKAGLARLLERLSWDRQRWSTEDTKLVKEVATLLRSEYPELLQSNWVPRSVVTTIDLIR
ncbi:RNF148 [Symbiodinium sp. CCMP2592]|nr:RNF148 [Symbiodinium sp. CCMP2592]